MLAFYGGKPVAGPSFLYLSGPCGRLGGRHHVDAHVRPLLVVELHGASDRAPRLGNVAEHHALEQLVLHRAVDAFRLRVLLRVPAFRHADADAVPAQLRDVFAAGILAAPVGVVDEPAPLDPPVAQSHPQGFQGAGDAQRLAHAPSDYFLGISVHDHGQVAERVAVFLRPHGDIGDVANPQPVRSVGNVLLHEVGINRSPWAESVVFGRRGLSRTFSPLSESIVMNASRPTGALPLNAFLYMCHSLRPPMPGSLRLMDRT